MFKREDLVAAAALLRARDDTATSGWMKEVLILTEVILNLDPHLLRLPIVPHCLQRICHLGSWLDKVSTSQSTTSLLLACIPSCMRVHPLV